MENGKSDDSQHLSTSKPLSSREESDLSISHKPPIQYSVPGLPDSAGAVVQSSSKKTSAVSKPSMSKFDTKGDQDITDEDQPKVSRGNFLVRLHYSLTDENSPLPH